MIRQWLATRNEKSNEILGVCVYVPIENSQRGGDEGYRKSKVISYQKKLVLGG
jgi:hypothetical protein